ncbi:hypothetical protein LIER_41105 [Lithospermum erythrorhizon]|uniref:DUF4218 domain-containing protein n=1 Tax=Lithospermum erythrorhizon TaxID=34254 RepID=A0AAV3R6C2_LITER
MRHRRFLPKEHGYRKAASLFDGKCANRGPPPILMGQVVFDKVKNLQIPLRKINSKSVPSRGFKKCSIFWELTYWKDIDVRHFIDLMHQEKNVTESFVSKLLGTKGKRKDIENSRNDLIQLGIREELRPVKDRCKTYCAPAVSTLSKTICSKVIDPDKIPILQAEIVEILCMLEMYFPPYFFDIMVHLTVHLVEEIEECGPPTSRWMYPFERYMKVLNGYVKNRSRPEGCIAERYFMEEAVECCTEYVTNLENIGLPVPRHASNGVSE